MNFKQYNNIIDYTLKHDADAQTDDSLKTARTIFNNMGVALPNGSMNEVYETIKTDSYMGWKSCSMEEAQKAANKGVAAIGINENRIVVVSANDEEDPVTETASVMALDKDILETSASGLAFYQYANMRSGGDQYGATWGSLDAAMDYYGTDYTYTYCGGYYNYYYTFSDGSRMYFRVA